MNAFLKQMKFYAVVKEDFFFLVEDKSNIIEMCVILL